MSFVALPIFIGSNSMDRSTFKILISGLSASFIVVSLLIMLTPVQTTCDVINAKDSQAVKDWKHTCLNLLFNERVGFPLMFGLFGVGVLALGILKLYLNREEVQNEVIKQFKTNRTYPKGFTDITQKESTK